MRRLPLLMLLGLLGGLALTPLAAAQPSATAIPPAATPEAVVSAALAPLGAGAHAVVFSRATLPPGQTLSLGATAGPAFAFVASGSATVTAQTAGARAVSASASNAVAQGGSAALDAGALLLLDAGATVALTNGGDAPVQLLNAVVLPVGNASSGTPATAKPSFTDPLALPSNAIQVVVSRVVLAPGAGTDAQSTSAPQVLAVQNGTAVISLNPGKLRVLRSDGSLEFVAGAKIDPAALPTLDANDAEERETIEAQGGSTIQKVHGAQVGLSAGDAGLLEGGGTWSAQNPASTPTEVIAITLAPAPAGTPTA